MSVSGGNATVTRILYGVTCQKLSHILYGVTCQKLFKLKSLLTVCMRAHSDQPMSDDENTQITVLDISDIPHVYRILKVTMMLYILQLSPKTTLESIINTPKIILLSNESYSEGQLYIHVLLTLCIPGASFTKHLKPKTFVSSIQTVWNLRKSEA